MSEPMRMSWKQATELAGRTVVLTGCASGIGRATAQQFAAAGVKVYAGDVNERDGAATIEAIRQGGGQGEFVPLDLTQASSIDAFVDEVKRRSAGQIDIIASIAGIDRIEPFLKNTPEIWDKIIGVNYLGPVRMIHRLLPAMVERGVGGRIITISSDAGRVGSTGETFYSGTKGAVISFTKALAREMARHGIKCNCVAPGPTDTPLFTVAMDEKLRDSLVKAIPLRRMANPVEIANVILFFASPAADYITGQVLSVSGGLTMHG
ncbi:MAG TPA: SDR family NAD(P)-dependent oxidoreductase [Steroidobacteraceae bacterium]|nr:SDR family NAD(P)-dependent oxidoreductase [Steroidobacteraceae bacterium]